MIRVQLLTTDGPYLEAVIKIGEKQLCVMDDFSAIGDVAPESGDEFDLELTTLIDDEESWESIVLGNPERKVGLESLGGWRYRAYGQVAQVHPVVVNCGLLCVGDPILSSDARLIGEYIAFTISRLGGYGGAC